MKRIVYSFILAALIAISDDVTAQIRNGISYDNNNILGGGLSFGYYNYGYIGSRSIGFLPASLYLEMGLDDNITAGPFLGYARWSYRYTGFAEPYNYTWSFTNLGARGSWHVTELLNDAFGASIDEGSTDWYLTLIIGFEYRRYSVLTGGIDDHYSNKFNLMLGPLAGVRYYFGQRAAAYAEAGRGTFGILSFGLSVML
jgi:hypothetical protein